MRKLMLLVILFCLVAGFAGAQEKYITAEQACVQVEYNYECPGYRQDVVTLKQGQDFQLTLAFKFSEKTPCADKTGECLVYQTGKVLHLGANESRKLAYEWGGSTKVKFTPKSGLSEGIPASWFSGDFQRLIPGNYLIVLLMSTDKSGSGDLLRLEFPITIQ